MSVPQKSDKITDEDSVFTPEAYTQFKEKIGIKPNIKVPEILILCYQKSVLSSIIKKYKLKKVDGFFGDFYQFGDPYNKFSVIGNFGIGGPIVAMLVEEFSYLGVSKFISLGTAGSLQKNLTHGDLIICKGSIRDEGTSFHYLKPNKFISSSKFLFDKIELALKKNKIKFRSGKSWTIDAPFRETRSEIIQYQQEGILCVDMEASVLFSVTKAKNVEAIAVFIISDSLANLKWEVNLDFEIYKHEFLKIIKILLETF